MPSKYRFNHGISHAFVNSRLWRSLTPNEKAVWLELYFMADFKSHECYPSYANLARRANISRRTAIRCIQQLKKRKIIVIKRRFRPDGKPKNIYLLKLWPYHQPETPVTTVHSSGDRESPKEAVNGDYNAPDWCQSGTVTSTINKYHPLNKYHKTTKAVVLGLNEYDEEDILRWKEYIDTEFGINFPHRYAEFAVRWKVIARQVENEAVEQSPIINPIGLLWTIVQAHAAGNGYSSPE